MRRAAISYSIFWAAICLAACAAATSAAEVKIFRTEAREAVLGGTLDGVSVGPLGALELAPRLERLTSLEEPFVFSAAGHPRGWVLGTGNSGKVLLVDAGASVSELAAVAEPEIFAVHAEDDGTVFFGSSPKGKVYRVAAGGGEPEMVFDAGESYVWDLARDRRGRLLVATGLRGRLYRVPLGSGGGAGDAEVLLESRDRHVRALEPLADGSVLVGTAGQGLILKVSPKGEVSTLHDAVLPEVLTFAAADDGAVYAALMASEASQVDLSGQRAGSEGEKKGDGDGGEVSVVVTGETTIGSRSGGFSGPRSVILEIRPDGKVEQILEFKNETVHSLLWSDEGLWIGTGQEGHLYRWSDEDLVHIASLGEQQLVGLAQGGQGKAVASANAAAIFRLHDGRRPEGTYTSGVLDAGQVARFGSFLWEGGLPEGSAVELAFRSGMSSKPDDTWTEWSCEGCGGEPCHDGEAGCETRRHATSLADLAHGRYVQWRAVLRGGDVTPRLEASELTYRQENLRPKIEKLEVLDPGQILVPQSFNPTSQTFEPWSPNREGIFTTLRKDDSQNGDNRFKNLWKKGYRTLRWTAKDENDDTLSYRLEFRPEAAASNGHRGKSQGGAEWLAMVDELDEEHYSFDSTVLPDGIYRFRLTASDRPEGPASEELSEDELSEAVVVDHSPPVLESVKREGRTLSAAVRDELSPLRDAVVSVDAGEWQPAETEDGLLDGRRETLRVTVPSDARMVLLRLTDAHFNVITLDLLSHN